ncbi:ArsR/SmtB family transcription factor [Actinophytocola sediminis]
MRIHFTDLDLARTRLKLDVDPLWELVNSVQALQHPLGGLNFDHWRRAVRTRAGQDPVLRQTLPRLMELAPHATYFPDFLTPADAADADADADTAVDAVLTTPRRRLRTEIGRLHRPTPQLGDLADGNLAALRDLRTTLRAYYRQAVRPHLPQITGAIRLDSADRIHAFLRSGAEAMLATLEPVAVWRRPVLSFDYPIDRDLHLDGRGLLIIPSYFCLGSPVSLADPGLRPVLVYPVAPEARLLGAPRGAGDHLGALLGSTRATILRSLVRTATTTDLARRVRISAATVSHHTAVLRNSGLIASRRHHTFVIHMITPLGLRLLASG